MEESMRKRLEAVTLRYEEIERELEDPALSEDIHRLTSLSKEQSGLRNAYEKYARYRKMEEEHQEAMEAILSGEEELAELIRASREGLRDCSANPVVVAGAATPAKKARAAASAGPAKINLVRLDYRRLHGQVVFSWVTKVGAERIIVVDNDAAGDDVKKSALRLAKPSGVRLNVFTVERALAKMAKLNTLGENVMFVFGNTCELLEFNRSYKFDAVNLGATANHDGAEQDGGSDSSVFFDASQKADVNELLKLGVKLFVQQTPTQKRVDITSPLN